MPRLRDRCVLVVAFALAAGGWVCNSNIDDPCPGGLSCEIDTANVCCPFGSSAWCGACIDDAFVCREKVYFCDDKSRILDCSFNAMVGSAQCTNPRSVDGGVEWTFHWTGTLTGCGQETVFFAVENKSEDKLHVDCGSWMDGVFGGCVPPGPDTSTTTWTLDAAGLAPMNGSATVMLELTRAHGTNVPPLVQQSFSCGP